MIEKTLLVCALIIGSVVLCCFGSLLFDLMLEPLRQKERAQQDESIRLEAVRRTVETPPRIDLRGMSEEQIAEKYEPHDGHVMIKDVEYILADGMLWRVESLW